MKKFLVGLMVFMPITIFAAPATDLAGTAGNISGLVDTLYNVLIAVVFLVFAWGIVKFIFQDGDDREKGKTTMIWSIVAIVVLFSIGGIVSLIQGTAGVSQGDNDKFTAPTSKRIL